MVAEFDSFSSIPAAFFDIAARMPDEPVYGQPDTSGGVPDWRATSYRECMLRVKKIARFLQGAGLAAGDTVAMLSQSRPEWMEADMATLAAGGVSVSVYQSLPADDIGYILFDSGASIVFAENKEQVDKLLWLVTNEITIPATEERPEQNVKISLRKIFTAEAVPESDLVTTLATIFDGPEDFDAASMQKLTREDLAALVYTSGTTGPPKGVMQTHGNHLANCRQAWNAQLLQEGYSIMVFLPLAHAFAKLMGYLGFLSEGTLYFPSIASPEHSRLDPAVITRDIREGSANVVPIVPRLLEKMQSGILGRAKGSGMQARLVRLTLWGAREMYAAGADNRAASLLVQIVYGGTSGIRARIRQQLFGPNFRYAVSGGAKLNPATSRFFDMLDIEVLEGYGLTETCVATNVNRIGHKKIGTVGPVLDDDIELALADDSEILFRGPNITSGYYHREQATRAAWDSDGWFHTGDLGEIDKDGFLSIVGRKKDILVTSYGKNVAPEEIEALVKNSQYISQAVMVGDGRPYCIVLVTLETKAVLRWAQNSGVPVDSATAHQNSAVEKLIKAEVDTVNRSLASHEEMKRVIVLPGDFTVENGLLTPTFKVKKRLVLQKFADQINTCYGDAST